MDLANVSKIIDCLRTGWDYIANHKTTSQLVLIAGLSILLLYLLKNRRSKTLSVLVNTEFKKYKSKLCRQTSLSEKLSSRCFIIFAFILPNLVILIVGSLILWHNPIVKSPKNIERFLATLHTCGGVVAAFTAILVTIIIFSVTVNSTYLVRASSLFKFYLRQLYFWPILAFAGGTVAGCLFNSVLINHFDSWPILTITSVVFLSCSVIALEIILLYKAVPLLVRSVISKFLAESYVAEHRDSLSAHVKRKLAQTIFVKHLEGLGFSWNVFGLYKATEHVEYSLSSKGLFVNDVYFKSLKNLTKRWNLIPLQRGPAKLNRKAADPPNILIWPGEKLSEEEEKHIAMNVKGGQKDLRGQRLFAKSFVCAEKDKWHVPIVEWTEISHLLRTLIIEKDINGIKSVLEAFRVIVEDYLKTRRDIDWPHTIQTLDEEIMSSYRAPTLRNLDFLNFLKFTIRNEDEECVDEISGFLYRIAYTAFEFKSEQYFDEVLVRINWLYQFSRGSELLEKSVAATVIRRYENIGNLFDSHIYKDEANPQLYRYTVPFIKKYLKNILNAMKYAVKFDDGNTFQKLLEKASSLLEHHLPTDLREQFWYNYKRKNPELLKIQMKIRDIKLLSYLVIASWLYRSVNEGEYDKEIVKPLINTVIDKILDFQTLLETYLFAQSIRHHKSGLDYDYWDVVPNVMYHGDAFSRWIEPFWLVIALRRAASKPKIDTSRIRLLAHISEFNCQTLASQIDSLAKNSDHKWLTTSENLMDGKDYLLGVFGALAQRQKKIDYEDIIKNKITDSAIDAFKKRTIEAYENETKLRNLFKVYKPASSSSGINTNTLKPFHCWVDKSDLTEQGRDTGLARICGQRVGRRETLFYAGEIEDRLVEKGTIQNFDELKAKIKNEATNLRQKGFNPQVVFIPWDHRYESILTDIPDWKRKCPIKQSPIPRWIASIDEMQVFVWPHKDSECIGIIDLSAFARFTNSEEKTEKRLEINFRKLKENELNQFLTSEKNNRECHEFKRWLRALEYDVNKVSEMKRIVVIQDTFHLEVLQDSTGVKLLPSKETMGIVYKEGETIYHLPNCKLAKEITKHERRYFRNLGIAQLEEKFRPCKQCKPSYRL